MNESKFDGKGKIYGQYRPRYSELFIEYLFTELGMTKNSVVADIGSGTGILTGQLLERGGTVFGIEPNAEMRAVAEVELAAYGKFTSVATTAENTSLESSAVDFVTAAQAFHWFDKPKFKAECRRILRASGKVVLVWNSRNEKGEVMSLYRSINEKYCPLFKGFSGGIHNADNAKVFDEFFDGGYIKKQFDNPVVYDEAAFIGRSLSSSYAPKPNEANYEPYIAELRELFAKHCRRGVIVMPYYTECYIGGV